jgi:hypothetical protein
LSGALHISCFTLLEITISESRLTMTQTPTGTAMHGDQMEETSTPPIRKKSGWCTDPEDRTDDEVWHKYHEPATDQRSSERNKPGSHQALSLAELSIAAQRAQSHHLAFKFSSVHAFCGKHFASRRVKISSRNWPAYSPGFFPIVHTVLRRRHKPTSIFCCMEAHTQRTIGLPIFSKNELHPVH